MNRNFTSRKRLRNPQIFAPSLRRTRAAQISEPLTGVFVVGLPGFEPGTSASRTEPWSISPVLVRRRISENVQVNVHILDPSADRSRPRNTAVPQRSAPFPRQCALRREILLTQIGCSAFTVLIDVFSTRYSVKNCRRPLKGSGHRMPLLAIVACARFAQRGDPLESRPERCRRTLAQMPQFGRRSGIADWSGEGSQSGDGRRPVRRCDRARTRDDCG
jgi:hypothetical protein